MQQPPYLQQNINRHRLQIEVAPLLCSLLFIAAVIAVISAYAVFLYHNLLPVVFVGLTVLVSFSVLVAFGLLFFQFLQHR